jgi:hypothetical protein|tara:strand:- start:1348 stop:1647 length:300 start_codon:yes stop_codon:yes gene_type:complete
MKFYVKVYRFPPELLIAACDEKVYGRIYKENGLVLKGDKKFYGDELMTEKETQKLLKQASMANLLGKNIVKQGIDIGIINSDNVIVAEGVPHAQMVQIL